LVPDPAWLHADTADRSAEAPSETQIAAALRTAASGGGVTDLRTTLAMTSLEAKGAFAAANDLMRSYQSPGGI
jgi:hypothetical protein